MKGFTVLLTTFAATLTYAAPQYNYAQPSGSFAGGSGFNNIGSGVGAFVGGGSGGNGGYSNGNSGGGYAAEQPAIITKQFFIHSAPEEAEERGADKVLSLGPARKHYRVVFIKAPHQGVQAGRVRVITPANEEKTAIYVLSKKTDVSEIQADVQQAHSEPTKPEVHFIKYKTNEEAAHAQRTIQAQYDAIQGTSQVSDEGVAPLTSVIGALGSDGGLGGHGGASGGFSGASGTYGAPANTYLPPGH
ncbi:pupal cuticle protein 36a-like [Condylostylus longicornis]|uniref:pupal cuticle protein 36a-like n=1 Tax=Condylostylus longicornis TaxID=2530218 RepID=UPI00244DF244|nr:pupal cuticle protein 36a-like [Condylostylus longicornis]